MQKQKDGSSPVALPWDASACVAYFLFQGIAIISVFLLLLPMALLPCTPVFVNRLTGVAVFVVVCVERMWAMYFRSGLRNAYSGAGRDWTAIAVGYAYALTFGASAVEFLLRQHGFCGWFSVGGAIVYGVGVALRYWAFFALRHQWHVDVSDVEGERHLVREGPYRHMRHPLYFGACLEVIGLPVLLGAWGALAIGVLVFMPLEIIRAYYEERFLRKMFGASYQHYAAEVWAFFPLPFRRRRRP